MTTPSAQTRTWTLDVSPGPKVLTANEVRRMHWRAQAARVKTWREYAYLAALESRVPACGRIEVELIGQAPDRRIRDESNLMPTMKACVDGLVDAGVVPGDDKRYVRELMPRIVEPPVKGWRLYLKITDLGVTESEAS